MSERGEEPPCSPEKAELGEGPIGARGISAAIVRRFGAAVKKAGLSGGWASSSGLNDGGRALAGQSGVCSG